MKSRSTATDNNKTSIGDRQASTTTNKASLPRLQQSVDDENGEQVEQEDIWIEVRQYCQLAEERLVKLELQWRSHYNSTTSTGRPTRTSTCDNVHLPLNRTIGRLRS
ncbi:hypothetical protein BGZ97_012987 [Linnemannia gamsii]|uniref:Uncharacterized protein n=1 Tax=Linnemannia gamsii TaxID=64522 RepID=A0A9P6R0C7_9FUNG|nr:hypothetical protein BGZ97_012987 [Linnemannia gamsii]